MFIPRKSLILNVVARDGIEPPPPAFSVVAAAAMAAIASRCS
jgi:hypothetical protein